MKAVIFDLDMTLVDSSGLENARRSRDWKLVYSLIPTCQLYNGIESVFSFIRENKIKVCIVSTAPRPYVEKMVRYFNIPCNYIVGYHDASPIKPHPAPMIKALELLEEPANNVVSFGDRSIDIVASKRASIKSVGCCWGTSELQKLIDSEPEQLIHDPISIIQHI